MDKTVQNEIMGMGNFLVPRPKGQRKIRMICTVGDVGELDMGGKNAKHLDRAIISLLKLALANRNLNDQWGVHRPSVLSQ